MAGSSSNAGQDLSQLSPNRKFPNKGRGKVTMIRPNVWDTDTLRNVAEVEAVNAIDVDAIRRENAELSQKELSKKITKMEDEMVERIRGDKSVQTSTQLHERLLQELEVMIKIRRENTTAKLQNPETLGMTFCPPEQGVKRRTVGDRSFTDVDNSMQGEQY